MNGESFVSKDDVQRQLFPDWSSSALRSFMSRHGMKAVIAKGSVQVDLQGKFGHKKGGYYLISVSDVEKMLLKRRAVKHDKKGDLHTEDIAGAENMCNSSDMTELITLETLCQQLFEGNDIPSHFGTSPETYPGKATCMIRADQMEKESLAFCQLPKTCEEEGKRTNDSW